MNLFGCFKVLFFLILFNSFIFANEQMNGIDLSNLQISCNDCHDHHSCFKCHFGSAGFSVSNPDLWYEITPPPYPNTVLLSKNRNVGFEEGDVELVDSGLLIEEDGNYFVTYLAILVNNDPMETPLIPTFLALNGEFDPLNPQSLGNIVVLPNGIPTSVQISGILKHVKKGTALSILATNGGSPLSEPLSVVAWEITTFKIPCDSGHRRD